jgi:hypothetical protein
MRWMLKSRRLFHVDRLLEVAMEECTAYINLMDWPTCRDSKREHCSNGYRLDYRAIGF